jgi:hypothetical protein
VACINAGRVKLELGKRIESPSRMLRRSKKECQMVPFAISVAADLWWTHLIWRSFFLNGTVECWCTEVFSLEEHSRQRREIRIYLTNQKASFELVSRIMKFVDPWQE